MTFSSARSFIGSVMASRRQAIIWTIYDHADLYKYASPYVIIWIHLKFASTFYPLQMAYDYEFAAGDGITDIVLGLAQQNIVIFNFLDILRHICYVAMSPNVHFLRSKPNIFPNGHPSYSIQNKCWTKPELAYNSLRPSDAYMRH